MKITLEELELYADLTDSIKSAAVEIGKIQGTFPHFEEHDIEGIEVDLGRKQIEVNGSVYNWCDTDYFTIVIPFSYFEDPVVWEEQYEEEKHRQLLESIEEKRIKEENRAIAIEAGERKLLAELKEKYDD